MTFAPQRIALGGLEWTVPRLPWRLARVVQPALLGVYAAAGGQGLSVERIASLKPEDLDRLADAIYLTTTAATAGPKIDRAAFDELPIGVSDLMQAFPGAARCAGMMAGAEAASGPKAEPPTLPAYGKNE